MPWQLFGIREFSQTQSASVDTPSLLSYIPAQPTTSQIRHFT